MEVTEIRNDGLLREYRVALPAADISRKMEARLSELARTMKLPGFRPGKVPMAIVRQRFGEAVRGEVLEQLISDSSRAVISERNLRPAATPQLSIAAYENDGDLEYSLAVEVLPEIVPPDYSQISLERLVAEPEEDEISRTLERLARMSRTFADVAEDRPAAAGDLCVVTFVGPADRRAFVGEDGREVPIEVGPGGPVPGIGEQLEGARVGDRRTLTVAYPEDYELAELRGATATYEVEVVGLREAPPVALDDDLAKRFGFENLEALRAEVRAQRSEELKAISRQKIKRALLDRLDELYAFDLPQGLVNREYQNIVRQLAAVAAAEKGAAAPAHGEPGHMHDETCAHEHGHGEGEETAESAATAPDDALSEEQRAEYRALAERRVRLGLVLAEIGRRSELKVTPEELSRAIVNEARRFPGQEREVIEYFRQHGQAREGLAAPILEDKVVDYILELATVRERRVSVEELLREVEDAPMSPS